MSPSPGGSGRYGTRHRLLTWSAVVVVSVTLALAASWIYTHDDYWSRRWTVDLTVYLASGETVREGGSLYDLVIISPLYGEMPYLYPPLTALLFFVPLSFLPMGAASLVWNSASLVALGAVVWLTLGIAGVRDDRTRSVLTVAGLVLAACLLPVRIQLIAGQINMFLLLLVLLDFSRRSGRLQGVGIGIAAGLKVTPLIFIVYLAVTRRWAAARNALAAFLATVAAGFLVLPADAARYWGGLVFHSSRAGGVFDTPNQSLAGAMARALSSEQFANWWLLVMAVVGLWGMAVALSAFRRGADFLGFSATAITGLLISPVSWEHHWVYVIPLLVWLAVRAHRQRSLPVAAVTAGLVAVFTVRVFMLVGIQESPPAPMSLAVWQQVVAAAFPLTGLALLVFGPLWLRRHFPAAESSGESSAESPV
ncbi:MAG TPA: glycosyltransferase 87 family protein, partial [Streptomyces sp.]|nr:glycosyltransferase 87 family protein [Streptomyces sp.]